MKRAYSTLISAVPIQGPDMASLFVTWPKALSIASFSVVVATGINAAMCAVISRDLENLRTEVKAEIKDLKDDMREIRVMLSRRWF
jgi:phosphoribosylcarboxyaminoimidazole (NCAIR) mutase